MKADMWDRRIEKHMVKGIVFLVTALLCGILYGLSYSRQGEAGSLTQSIIKADYVFFSSDNAKHASRSTLLLFLEQTTLLYLFQIFFGYRIAGKLDIAGAYYFTRQSRPEKWFLEKAGEILGLSAIATGAFFGGRVAITLWGNHYTLTKEALLMFLVIVSWHALYLFFFTLFINVLALVIEGIPAFLIVVMLQQILMGPMIFIGNKKFCKWHGGILIKINPISHLMYSWHSGNGKYMNELKIVFPIWNTYVYFGVILTVLLAAGCILIKYRSKHI